MSLQQDQGAPGLACRMMIRKVGTLHMPTVSCSSSPTLCVGALVTAGVPDLRCKLQHLRRAC